MLSTRPRESGSPYQADRGERREHCTTGAPSARPVMKTSASVAPPKANSRARLRKSQPSPRLGSGGPSDNDGYGMPRLAGRAGDGDLKSWVGRMAVDGDAEKRVFDVIGGGDGHSDYSGCGLSGLRGWSTVLLQRLSPSW